MTLKSSSCWPASSPHPMRAGVRAPTSKHWVFSERPKKNLPLTTLLLALAPFSVARSICYKGRLKPSSLVRWHWEQGRYVLPTPPQLTCQLDLLKTFPLK